MAGPGDQHGRGDTDILIWVGIGMGLFLLAGVGLDRYRADLNSFYGTIAVIHVAPYAWLTKLLPFLGFLDIPFGRAELVYDFLARGGYADMTPEQASIVNRTAAFCAVPIYGGPLLWIVARAIRVRPEDIYNNRHNMDSMIAEHAKSWWTGRLPRSINFLKEPEFDLRVTADEVGRRFYKQCSSEGLGLLVCPSPTPVAPPTWARSLRPEEWLLANGATYDEEAYSALTGSDDRSKAVSFTNESAADYEFGPRWETMTIDTVRELLEAELGPVWTGQPEKLPAHLRALMAVCAQFLDFNTSGGNRMLQDMGALYELVCRDPVGTFDRLLEDERRLMADVDGVLKSQAGTNLLERMSGHYYLYTACCRMMEVARKDRGVLAGGSFQWLKRENRRLWYVLAALGSEVASIEGAAAISHYRAEVQYECPMARPATYQAARAVVEDYLDMRPERVEQRRKKEARSRTPGQTIKAIFVNPNLLEEEEAAAEAERAQAAAEAESKKEDEEAPAGRALGGPSKWGDRPGRPGSGRLPGGGPAGFADERAHWERERRRMRGGDDDDDDGRPPRRHPMRDAPDRRRYRERDDEDTE